MFPAPISGFGAIPQQSIPGPWSMPIVAAILLAVMAVAALVLWRLHEADRAQGSGPDIRRPVFGSLDHHPSQRAA
ncbi:MAG: hypothetical protein ACKOCT_09020 [Alphaproteobacteria bacterium]